MGFVTKPHPHSMVQYKPNVRHAPMMRVAVRHRARENRGFLLAFLDNGADRSILSPWSLRFLEDMMGCKLPIRFYIRGAPFYDLAFSFDDGEHWFFPDTPVEYATSPRRYPWKEDMLIGRDLLGQFEFCCNGPAKTFSLQSFIGTEREDER